MVGVHVSQLNINHQFYLQGEDTESTPVHHSDTDTHMHTIKRAPCTPHPTLTKARTQATHAPSCIMNVKALYRQEQLDVKLWREREKAWISVDFLFFSVCGEAYMFLASLFLFSQEGGENPLSLLS